jgi:FAD/FMN-containing dehydrogenase
MSVADRDAVARLERELRGQVLLPGGAGYDEARVVFNGMIARCRTEADVAASLGFARGQGLQVAVRGGGHNVAGNAVCDGGLVIDLSHMRRVEVDAGRRRAYVQGGATWGELDSQSQVHGLATPGGIVSSTGVAGLTLGGGIGVLRGLHGLTCDNLVAAEVVTAAGDRVRASAEGDGELLWGLRGGGGNFGVVTTFVFDLHPVDGVISGPLDFPFSRDFLSFYDEFVEGIPDEFSCDLLLRRSPHGEPIITLLTCFCGPAAVAAPVYERLGSRVPAISDGVAARSYVGSQRTYDGISPWGWRNYWKTGAAGHLGSEAIDALAEVFLAAPSQLSQVQLEHLHGAMQRTPPGVNAVSFSGAKFNLLVNAKWTDRERDEENVRWAREGYERLRPFAQAGTYVNYLFQETTAQVRRAYGEAAYRRLVALKDRCDPDNVFRLNQNIEPSRRED